MFSYHTIITGAGPWQDLPNTYMTKIKMPTSLDVGSGYSIQLCASVRERERERARARARRKCFTRGAFTTHLCNDITNKCVLT